VSSVRLHPDGKALVYSIAAHAAKDNTRITELWIGDVEGRNRRLLASGRGAWPVWSPDGEGIIASTVKDKKMRDVEAWRMNGDGSNPTRMQLPASELVWDWSADGKWFVTLSGSDDQIYVMRPDGTERRRLTKGGFDRNPRFAPDSRRIVYSRQQRGSLSFSLRMVDLDGRNDRELFRPEGVVLWSHCWSPDGRHLAVAMCDLQKLPGGDMALIAGEEEAGWQKLPGGGMGLIAGDAEAQDWRIAIIDVSSQNLRELRLGGVRTFHIGSLDWR
jgi:Tol biopolymer transport system component